MADRLETTCVASAEGAIDPMVALATVVRAVAAGRLDGSSGRGEMIRARVWKTA